LESNPARKSQNQERKMSSTSKMPEQASAGIPDDDPGRGLVVAQADTKLPHLGIVGDTYTILLGGKDTARKFCLIDMHIPPGGGPPPHRHDFEEAFTLLEGELTFIFRGKKSVARAGETVHVPANAPHQFHNSSAQPARLLCICAPAGQGEFFMELGVPVATRTTAPPKFDDTAQGEFRKKAGALAPKYRTELLEHA
jgi:quercetin dioxygenase-like cupin family protein